MNKSTLFLLLSLRIIHNYYGTVEPEDYSVSMLIINLFADCSFRMNLTPSIPNLETRNNLKPLANNFINFLTDFLLSNY